MNIIIRWIIIIQSILSLILCQLQVLSLYDFKILIFAPDSFLLFTNLVNNIEQQQKSILIYSALIWKYSFFIFLF